MFGLTWGEGVNMAFPDACLTPIGPIVVTIPYPNVSETASCSEPIAKVLLECMPAMNQVSTCELSEGDQPGVGTGVASHMVGGPTTYVSGSTAVVIQGTPAMRLTSVTGQNAMEAVPNTAGATIAPSQETVLFLK